MAIATPFALICNSLIAKRYVSALITPLCMALLQPILPRPDWNRTDKPPGLLKLIALPMLNARTATDQPWHQA